MTNSRVLALGRAVFVIVTMALINPVFAAPNPQIDIPFKKFVLDNGLTLIVHEDKKAPVVAVNVWYHVGSKNEKAGKTGFAHLFEHLMFNGSENYNDDYFKPFDRVGATGMNGTTNFDRTNYFQVVPKNALDTALWMESDRMGHLLGAVDQDKLDEQRGVVQNEKRQGENQPYGKVFTTILDDMFPNGHPYQHSVIGSMDDLNAADLDDVHEWFNTYYGAQNTTIVIAGDVETAAVKKRVEHFFGHIPAGSPLTKHNDWVAQLDGDIRTTMQDRVPQARIYKLWKMPAIGSKAANQLDLIAGILSEGKNSRLYKRLVYDDQIASGVEAFAYPLEISGMFGLVVTALPGQDLNDIEKAMDEEIERFLKKGPTKEEIKRVVTERIAGFIRGNERIGGFGGKSDTLAYNQVFTGQPDFYKTTLKWWNSTNKKELTKTAKAWMRSGEYVLEVHPFKESKTSENLADRSKLPDPGTPPQIKFAELQHKTLSNGLKVILAQRNAVPVVEMHMTLDAGYAADQFTLPGTASLTMDMLDEGTKNRDALTISRELQLLGAKLRTGSNLDRVKVTLSALTQEFDRSLEVYADVILNPTFPKNEFARLKTQRLAKIQQEKSTPAQMARRVFPELLYGEGHAYGLPMTGSGYEHSVNAMSPETLSEFHQAWFKPNNATLVVVGNIAMDTLSAKLEKSFGDWKAGEIKDKKITTVAHKTTSQVYIIDKPDAEQSIIFAGHIAPPKDNQQETAIQAMNEVLGGSFNSRINMNLREDKHWSYGARSMLADAQGQRPYIIYAPVQTSKTKESMAEIYKELSQLKDKKPPTDQEIARAKDKKTLTLPGRWETNNAVAQSILEMVRFGYQDNYWDEYSHKVRNLNRAQILKASQEIIQPDKLIWVIVGDRKKIEAGIEDLKFGKVTLLGADGSNEVMVAR